MRFATQNFSKFIPLAVATLSIGAAFFILFLHTDQTAAPGETARNIEKEPQETQTEDVDQTPAFIDLQPTLNTWAARQSGTASVIVYDLDNDRLAGNLNPDERFFAASIYKLYVAYVGYQKVADGTYSLDEPYLNGQTRGECLVKMLRDSDSPCGEKMWVELGKANIDETLQGYGIANTSMTGLYTSASDAAILLRRLHNRTDLTEQHAKLMLDSLKDQDARYRRGLPSGFPDSGVNVYNKVGWNLDQEWHDTALVTLDDGRSYIVSVLTTGVGFGNVADLGQAIYSQVSSPAD